jgi:OOP family OmpA-OmpF porin
MKTISFSWLSPFVAATLFVSPLIAGLTDPTELGVQAGYLLIEGDSNLKNAVVYGARFGSYLNDHTSLELSVLAGESDIRHSDRTADLLLPTVEGLYYLGQAQSPWRPYLAGGAGFLQANRDRLIDHNHIDFALTYGGGVKYTLRPFCVARGDVRDIIDTQSGKGTHNALVSLGISWLYGGSIESAPVRKKQAAVAAPKEVKVVATVADRDHDGVPDDKDDCVDTPVGMKVDPRGCVFVQDSDQDGVPDDKDDCPGTVSGTKVGADGCPDEAKAVPEDAWILNGVTFEKGADTLSSNKQLALDNAIEILKNHPKIRVEIQGHTDSFGKDALNQNLSERRAQSVKNYLVQNGIAADRLETKGYGETKPIASNATPEGRAKNRRIEFKVLSR